MVQDFAGLAWRRLAAGVLAGLFLCLPAALAEQADRKAAPRSGLMWNRTGLPAVFPLQVKSPAGADYYLVLSGSGGDALAAYVRGGAFFKVLVPPGRFKLRFASGRDWKDEERLFGPDTVVFELPQVLEFAVRGAGLKAGHLVTLTRESLSGGLRAEVKGQFVCQIASLEGAEPSRIQAEPPRRFILGGNMHARAVLHLRWRLGLTGVEPGTPDALWQRSLFVLGNPGLPRHMPQFLSPPQLTRFQSGFRSYSVRSLFCG